MPKLVRWIPVLMLAAGVTAYARPQAPAQPPAVPPAAAPAQAPNDPVRPIAPPATPLPTEEATRRLEKVSFIAYGDTRGGSTDGLSEHPIHSQLMNRMLEVIRARANSDRAIRFVLQTGDAVLRGGDGRMWNVSYTPIIERLTRGAGIPYFLTLGNHDVLSAGRGGTGQSGLVNSLRAMENLYPAAGSPRRYRDTATYALGIGPVFVIAIDSNPPAADMGQVEWVSAQLTQLDRQRYKTIVAFMHHPPYTSGPHGGNAALEPQTVVVRSTWMPLFRKHGVRLVLAGHEHFYERWVEEYRNGRDTRRIDVVVTGGGGAPTYSYRGEPDLTAYLAEGAAQSVRVEHTVKPGVTNDLNPNHFVVFDVDEDDIEEEVVALGEGPFTPFDGKSRQKLRD